MIKFENIQREILGKQLNLDKLLSLPKDQADIVLKLFNDLMDSFTKGDFQIPGGIKMDIVRMVILYNTLSDEGWIITRREKNLNAIID